ncbi:hypothetical protein [Hydrogenophaga sp.]|uniref:hypothetical protein n=1 Tax=Hydrogenophaga sp. TaxID=1904254 RepID=UPI0025B8EAAB|nr:hypothetical protein [Hydrogenophaga sp.]MBT9467105.1 hypothetical protein [Hydrogenophaga sp.]
MTAATASPAQAEATFSYEGAQIHLTCSSAEELQNALARFRIGKAAAGVADKPAASPAPAATKAPTPQAVEKVEGNASASTASAAPASAPAADAGSTGDAASPHPFNYNDVSARITALCKAPGGREKCLGLLKSYGDNVDHGNKLKLEHYVDFVTKADALIAGSAA